MKNFIFIALIMCMFTGISNAQLVTATLSGDATYTEISTDYTITDAVAGYYLINANQKYYTAQDLVIQLDSTSGNHTNVAVQLYGRVTDNSAWATIGSAVNWTGATADTTILYTNTTENGYRSYKVLFTGTGTGVTTISNLEFKQWLGLP